MRVLTKYGSHRNVELMVGLAVRVHSVPVATRVMLTGRWR